jgi:hypothetical protein
MVAYLPAFFRRFFTGYLALGLLLAPVEDAFGWLWSTPRALAQPTRSLKPSGRLLMTLPGLVFGVCKSMTAVQPPASGVASKRKAQREPVFFVAFCVDLGWLG